MGGGGRQLFLALSYGSFIQLCGMYICERRVRGVKPELDGERACATSLPFLSMGVCVWGGGGGGLIATFVRKYTYIFNGMVANICIHC
jgi:hypothetical protein